MQIDTFQGGRELINYNELKFFDNNLNRLKNNFDSGVASVHQGFICNQYFDWDDFDDALFVWEPDDDIKIYQDGIVPAEHYIESYVEFGAMKQRIIKHSFYEYIENGASVVLNKIQNKSRAINELCIRLAKFTHSIVNANAYAAKGGNGTFDMHWDTHDVFALQLIGRKRWRVYKPTFESPLPHQKSSSFKHLKPTTPDLEIVTEPGDLLYIPRGWWHEAMPLTNEETFHIAVGVFPIKLIDYIGWVLQEKITLDTQCRSYLNSFAPHLVRHCISQLNEFAASEACYQEFKEHYINRTRVRTGFNTGIFFAGQDRSKYNTRNDIFPSSDNSITANGVKVIIDSETASSLDSSIFDSTDIEQKKYELIKSLHKFGVVS